MARVAGTRNASAAAEAALMKALYDEHAAVLWRYALRLTGTRASPRMWSRKRCCGRGSIEVVGDTERSARAWLFTVARNMIIDDRRSARYRNVVGSTDVSGAPEQSTPDEVNAALDRLLIADAMAQLSADHRAVIERSYYRGWTTTQIAADLGVAEGTVKSRLHYAVRALRLTLQELGVTR